MTAKDRQKSDTDIFEAAEQRPDGWYVGRLGPFSTVHGARNAVDATCVIVGTHASHQSHVIIDGVLRDSFDRCEMIRTASGKLLVNGWKQGPGMEPRHGDNDGYLLHKKGMHGPCINLHARADISTDTFVGRRIEGQERHRPLFVFQNTAEFGPFSNIETITDATGAKYLLCKDERVRGASKVTVIDAYGCTGVYDAMAYDDRKALIGKNHETNTWYVIYGGSFASVHQDAVRISLIPLKRNLVQLVRTKAKDGTESESIYCDAVPVSDPYENIGDLEINENGIFSYTAFTIDKRGIRRYLACLGKVPTTLLG